MAVRKRKWESGGKKGFSWQADFTNPVTKKRVQPTLKGVRTMAEAKQAKREIYAALCKAERMGVTAVPTDAETAMRLEDFLARDLDRAIKPSTRALETHRHKPVLEFFGRNTPVSAITADGLRQYQIKRPGKAVANSTINDELSVLMSAMNRGKSEGRLWQVPTFPKKLPEKEPRRRFLLPDQIERFFTALRELYPETADQAEVIYRLGGLRPIELWRMKWSDVDFERATVTVESAKNGPGGEVVYRVLPLSPDIAEIIQRQPRKAHGLIFGTPTTERKGHAPKAKKRGHKDGVEFLGQYRFVQRFKEAAARAELPNPEKITPYALRHSAATNATGADVSDIAYMLGHRDASMTLKVYRHARNDRVQAGVGSLQRDKSVTSDSDDTTET